MSATNFKAALDGANVVSIAPDMSLVNNGRRPAVDMPSTVFGPAWQIIEQVADDTSTAPDYAAISYLSVAASLIGGKREASPYGSSWRVPAILWTAAVGDPSSRKSAPMRQMTKPLWDLQAAANEDHEEAREDWEAKAERAKVERGKWKDDVKAQAGTGAEVLEMPSEAIEPDQPPKRRFVISDCTPEAAAYVMNDNPQGTLAFNDELAGWLNGFDRYNPGGRPFWLEAFEGKPFSVTRKGEGSFDLSYLGISVLGSIQPDRLVELLAGANDGLVPRIIWAWPEKRPSHRPKGNIDHATLRRAYERLELLDWGQDTEGKRAPVVLQFSDAAANIFEGWEREQSMAESEGGSLFETFSGKMTGAVVRLSLVSELTAWAFGEGTEPHEIGERSVAAAIQWVEDYAKPMAKRVFGDAAVSTSERHAAMLARYIRREGLDRINVRELRHPPHRKHLKPIQQPKHALEDAIEVLEGAGWVVPDPTREGGSKGQLKKDYVVVKAVHGREQ